MCELKYLKKVYNEFVSHVFCITKIETCSQALYSVVACQLSMRKVQCFHGFQKFRCLTISYSHETSYHALKKKHETLNININ